ncbi:acetyltransferase [Flavobacterium sp. F-380]|uniref:Acetyltransferase n=1 Tax=Flavobacterium kayseriense TaxID=2764714 RepID=A0ABR7J8F7_9FLAO|nr:acetyltransferase [Flavobacterium kayseriense]MBC5841477.1 acetyltransferase [Flavobacterium kayseriense]MBC5848005.1 acetyltransferase [Flavobacterium kayseriense]
MLVVGAKGFAKEVLEILHQNQDLDDLVFYDDVNKDISSHLYNVFPILTNKFQAERYFKTVDNRFTIGIGDPILRTKLYKDFVAIGGVFTSTISKSLIIGSYGTRLGDGVNIMQNVVITNDVLIGTGVILNQLTSIGHDVIIGDFSEISPNVSISGNCTLGFNVILGTGAIVLPKILIGNNVIVGAGAVVHKDLPDNCVAVGVPAKIIKYTI